MCPVVYHHNGFVATHAPSHLMYITKCMSCHKEIAVRT